jgi:predicted negative regulator of RcsB-dependent stress response
MEDTAFELQQLDKLKQWWAKNWLLASIVACSTAFSYAGWEMWQYNNTINLEKAASSFTQLLELDTQLTQLHADTSKNTTKQEQQLALSKQIIVTASSIVAEHSGVIYASLAQLLIAKHAVIGNKLAKAATALRWVIDTNANEELYAIATLRLAKVLWAQQKADAALSVLADPLVESFMPARNELVGDLYVAKGDLDKARASYKAASANGSASANLQRKINDIAP